jgi:hypothetical protein
MLSRQIDKCCEYLWLIYTWGHNSQILMQFERVATIKVCLHEGPEQSKFEAFRN